MVKEKMEMLVARTGKSVACEIIGQGLCSARTAKARKPKAALLGQTRQVNTKFIHHHL
jgi:hypothetical protein